MYCNFTKCQAFPFAIRASSQQPKCLLQFYIKPNTPRFLPISNSEKPICCSTAMRFRTPSFGFVEKTHECCLLLGSADRYSLVAFNQQYVGKKEEHVYAAKRGCFSIGFHSKPRKFSTSYSRKPVEGSDSVQSLPWLAKNTDKKVKATENLPSTRRSSWEESAKKFLKNGVENRQKGRRYDRRKDSWDESAEISVQIGVGSQRFDERNDHNDESDVESQELENPQWYKIKDRFDRFDKMVDVERSGNEFRKWNRQDNWGKKVWKEATESSIPKMVGECVYGVGPVLAALSANRREFYCLYVQEGVDLSGNNRKKKDKKGFEKVLRVAEKLGLPKKEISKHDLNMIVDNRPHQGLVLDASPLEMVNIRQLDRVVADGEEGRPLWLALDEVMDPQNLGAIIRSAYFFGASGVVLCAKNSAPLSGVVSKASAGSLELTELRSCKNMMQFLVSSAENGWRVLGGSVSLRAVALSEVTTCEPTVLVLGSEGTGLRPLVERSCTQLVKIPGNIAVHLSAEAEDVETEEFKSFLAVESLNVSVAAGVLLHHLVGTNNGKTKL